MLDCRPNVQRAIKFAYKDNLRRISLPVRPQFLEILRESLAGGSHRSEFELPKVGRF